jgi:signal transduction histidine kinase
MAVYFAAWAGLTSARTVGFMTTLVQRRYRRTPWSPRAWGQALFLFGGIPVQAGAALLVIAGFSVKPRGFFGLIFLLLVFFAVPLLTAIHRQRLRATAGIEIPRQPPIPNRLSREGLRETVRSRATWRQLGYHLVVGPALAAAAAAALFAWLAGICYTLVYLYASKAVPSGSLLRNGFTGAPSAWRDGPPTDVYFTLAGIVLLMAAPRLTAGVAALDAMAVQALLGPSRAEELEHRVKHLTQTRAGVVDAADAERRRLERDLHDGTQQRLVSLAMNLGMARAQVTTTDQARLAITEAHEEAKAALAELRDLIRGLHPAVLEDRGLDAALSGVAARMPIPVRLTVDLARRPPPVIEAVAYFVVSEGLANIAKHAQASQAEVVVQRISDRLHIIVSDDGVGGADPARGTGLTGLARRAESVDGHLDIASPPGGPTLLTVDLPCTR